jgi:hypothetical protein
MIQTRGLAAILVADVAGYSRLMGEDEEGTLAALKAVEVQHGMAERYAEVPEDRRIEFRSPLELSRELLSPEALSLYLDDMPQARLPRRMSAPTPSCCANFLPANL